MADLGTRGKNVLTLLRKFGIFSALVLVALILGLATAVLWPKPKAVILGGLSLLVTFGGLLALCRAAGPRYIDQGKRVIALVSVVYGVAFAALAWEYRVRAPSFAVAALINVVLLSLVVTASLLMRPTSQTPQ